ncbi:MULTISPECIES: baseplate J/gp47 family protein [unclassified Serratia (in: enterobacteria)]|uniref:baseplate J/gp47 family protein n=1 Tax=unclassified Serratia (in: enterobacteria) TaxID=2647522 RepID=UPI00050804FD|nr:MULTISPECIES: baseplate J/gp47 family protein [unclassified Serratia (in: enterobacteria)]KFK95012.1 phage baseplate protein [Serratia sp. Ag1]KFK96697.1 phage baseplate protein [Serratia sp. Ag2]
MADSGFTRPTLPQLITQIRSDLNSRFQNDAVLRRTDSEVYSRVQAAAVHTLYGYIDYLARNMLPDLCDEDWLVRHGNMKRCPRKEPSTATGFVRWEGVTNGITVPTGAVIQRDDLMEYTTTAAATSVAGILLAPVICSSAGIAGNTDDGIGMILTQPISGLPSAAVADGIEGGTDIESLEEWRARVIERWYYTPQGGADGDYIVWAKEVPGVTRAWTYRHWMGAGTVGVMVANSNLENPIPDGGVVAAVREHILPLAPVAGSSLYTFPPVAKAVPFRIRITPDTPAVRYAVIAELRAMFFRDGVPGGTLEHSRIAEAISIATGEYDHTLISPVGDVALGATELPVVGEVTWS